MPTVKYDMGGNLLTKDNCTLGHMQPHSKGGKSCLANYMLETSQYNMSKMRVTLTINLEHQLVGR